MNNYYDCCILLETHQILIAKGTPLLAAVVGNQGIIPITCFHVEESFLFQLFSFFSQFNNCSGTAITVLNQSPKYHKTHIAADLF